jgi:hypothetical protein
MSSSCTPLNGTVASWNRATSFVFRRRAPMYHDDEEQLSYPYSTHLLFMTVETTMLAGRFLSVMEDQLI